MRYEQKIAKRLIFEATGKNPGIFWELRCWLRRMKCKSSIVVNARKAHVSIEILRAEWRDPSYPIEKVMKLTAEMEGLAPDFSQHDKAVAQSYADENSQPEWDGKISFLTSLAFRRPYATVAKEILRDDAKEHSLGIEMEFLSRGGMPPNLVRVINHLRQKRHEIHENSHG